MAEWTSGSQQVFCSNDRVLSTPRTARLDLLIIGRWFVRRGGTEFWRGRRLRSLTRARRIVDLRGREAVDAALGKVGPELVGPPRRKSAAFLPTTDPAILSSIV